MQEPRTKTRQNRLLTGETGRISLSQRALTAAATAVAKYAIVLAPLMQRYAGYIPDRMARVSFKSNYFQAGFGACH